MLSSNDIQKNYNTHNGTICWNQRPCYRERTCDYCLNRKIKFICEQIEPMVSELTLCSFVTVGLPLELNPAEAVLKAAKLRKPLNSVLKRCGPYISVVALGEDGDGFTPHIHSLCGTLVKENLELEILKKSSFTQFNVHISNHTGDLVREANGRIGYMVKQNYRPTLRYKAKKQRLLTCSRGIYTGRFRTLATATTSYTTEADNVL